MEIGGGIKELFLQIFRLEMCKVECKRGSGECVRCHNKYSDIESEFRVRFKKMSKLSLLCKQCRKEVKEEMNY